MDAPLFALLLTLWWGPGGVLYMTEPPSIPLPVMACRSLKHAYNDAREAPTLPFAICWPTLDRPA